MGHVRGTWVAHYAAPAISCNQNENMLLLVAGDIGYPKVLSEDLAMKFVEFQTPLKYHSARSSHYKMVKITNLFMYTLYI